MAKIPLCYAPHPCLSTPTKPVQQIDSDILALLDEMLATMYAHEGIGLAANQVGVDKRLAVIDLGSNPAHKNHPRPLKLINPEIIWASEDSEPLQQGCLSVPGHYCDITRAKEVRIRYTDEFGKTQEIHGVGLMAHCLQHEMDHLNGRLIIDYLSKLKRQLAIRKVAKHLRVSTE